MLLSADSCPELDCNGLCLLTPDHGAGAECHCPDGASVYITGDHKTACDLSEYYCVFPDSRNCRM